MMSRDLDSLSPAREAAAVSEWLLSGRSFHVMRDNPQHGTEILGGTWGWRATAGTREKWARAWERILGDGDSRAGRGDWQPDQRLLRR